MTICDELKHLNVIQTHIDNGLLLYIMIYIVYVLTEQ